MSKVRQILSTHNPLLKVFRQALREGRTREGWLAVEGPWLLEEALKGRARVAVRSVLAGKAALEKFHGLLARLPKETERVVVSDRLFERIAVTETPQGLAALVELEPPNWEAVLAPPDVVLLVACGVQDPGNLGTMMRSAQALGASALVTLPETVSPFNPKSVRASAGAVFQLPIFPAQEAGPIFDRLRRARVHLIAADRRSPSPLDQADLRGRVAFLVGRESSGLSREVAGAADSLLSIPIQPGMDSVNAATAAAIFLYEAARQRGFPLATRAEQREETGA
jgi:TrmH family RNA methyltransferase